MKRDPRCKFTIQEEQEMISLYNDGLGLTQIGNKFNVYASTIWRILNRNCINLRSHGEGTRLLHQHMEIEPPQDFPWHLHDKFSKLLAIFLLTDGYMKSGGGIMLICTDKILQNYFLTLIKETYGLAPTVGSYMKKGKETVVHSKLVASHLFELSPTYKTSPRNCSLLEYFQGLQPSLSFLSNEEELLNEVIRIAMSTDGTVTVEFPHNTIYPKLEFSCAHPSLLKEWQTIFDSVGIKSFILRSNIT